jgi:hypothetical protein
VLNDIAMAITLIYDVENSQWIQASGVASTAPGGGTYMIWDTDAPPQTPDAMDDEFDDSSFDSGLWTEWDPGSAQTVTEDDLRLHLDMDSDAIVEYAGIYQELPASGDWAFVTKVSLSNFGAGLVGAGIILGEDFSGNPTTSNFLAYHLWSDGTARYLLVTSYADYATQPGSGGQLLLLNDYPVVWHGDVYLRVRQVSGTYYFDLSNNGLQWIKEYSTGSPPFTPDEIGLGAINKASGETLSAYFQFFRRLADTSFDAVIDGQKVTR